VGGGERGQDGGDLGGELARGREDEGERPAGAAGASRELRADARDEGEREGEGLAGAGASAAEHVASSERVGQGVDLDRERGGLAVGREGGDERGGHAERAEIGGGHVVLSSER